MLTVATLAVAQPLAPTTSPPALSLASCCRLFFLIFQPNTNRSSTQRFGMHGSTSQRGNVPPLMTAAGASSVSPFSPSASASPANGLPHRKAANSFAQHAARTAPPSETLDAAAGLVASSPRQAPGGWRSGAGGGSNTVHLQQQQQQQVWASRRAGAGRGGEVLQRGFGQMSPIGSHQVQVRITKKRALVGMFAVVLSIICFELWLGSVRARRCWTANGSDSLMCCCRAACLKRSPIQQDEAILFLAPVAALARRCSCIHVQLNCSLQSSEDICVPIRLARQRPHLYANQCPGPTFARFRRRDGISPAYISDHTDIILVSSTT